jgi:hypothetical protein
MLGSDMVLIENTPNYASFHIGSNSGGTAYSRQYYSNVLRLIKTQEKNSTLFAFELNKQVAKGLQASPQGGLRVGVYKNE